jgi:hypothetical protein
VGVPTERRRVIQILSEGYSRDLIELREYERRVDQAEAAQSLDELEDLVADLPAEVTKPTDQPQVPALDEGTRRVTAVMSSRTVTGNWLTTRSAAGRAVMGELIFDLRDFEFPPGVVDFSVTAIMGNIVIRVPRDVAVDVTATPIMGEVELKQASPPRRGERKPVLRVSGFALMASIMVRGE